MKRYIASFIAAALFLLLGAAAPALGNDTAKEETLSLTGTIVFVDLEGGFYGFIADSGEHYFPLNLEKQYKIDKTKVRIEGKIRKDIVTFTMWGTSLEILKIERL